MIELVLPVCAVASMVGFFIGLVLLIRWLGRAVHRSFAGWARMEGLEYHHDKLTPYAGGTLDGRAVQVANELMPSAGRAVPMFVVRVAIHGAPETLWMGGQPLRVEPAADRNLIAVSPDFDKAVFTLTQDEATARAWLSPERQRAVVELIARFRQRGLIEVGNVFVEEGAIVLRMTHMKKAKAAWIKQVVDALIERAAQLDAPA